MGKNRSEARAGLTKLSNQLVLSGATGIDRAMKRGDMTMLAKMIREQRHTLKWLERLKKVK